MVEKTKDNNYNFSFLNNPIFVCLNKDELDILKKNINLIHYKKGEHIFHQNRKPYEIFYIEKGIVKITYQGSLGKQQIVRLYKSGDILGYRSILANENYKCDCIAIEDSEICSVSKEIFLSLIQSNYKFCLLLLKRLALDLEIAEEKIVTLSQKNIRGRVSEALLFLKSYYGIDKESEYINVLFSREEMADFVGTSIETVIRTLSDFQKENLISFLGRKIKILKEKELNNISETN